MPKDPVIWIGGKLAEVTKVWLTYYVERGCSHPTTLEKKADVDLWRARYLEVLRRSG